MPSKVVYLDASYAIALAASSDQLHERAVEVADQLEAENVKMVTSRAVMLEIGNALAKQRYRKAAITLLDAMANDSNIEIAPLSEALFQEGWSLYQQRSDKEWGLTDCISFVLMKQRGLTDALTADEHFRQAGFRTLLNKDS